MFTRTALWAGVTLWVGGMSLLGQPMDPGAREDAAIERQKILKAADQIELLIHQNEKLQQDVDRLQKQVAELQTQKEILEKRIGNAEQSATSGREALLQEVAQMLASKPVGKVEPVSSDPGVRQEGYEHVVEKGQSLWAILNAYKDAYGIKTTIDDICRANHMDRNAPLKVGQKLFIPKL